MRDSRREGRFTALHLIILLIAISLCIFLLIPFFQLTRFRDRLRPRCMNNLKHIGLALKQYALDNNETFPWGGPETKPSCRFFGMLYPDYLSTLEVFRCPQSRDRIMDIKSCQPRPANPFTVLACRSGLSYAYGHNRGNPWAEKAASTVRIAADKYTISDYSKKAPKGKPSNHQGDGRNVVCLDGSAKWDNNKGMLEADPEWDVRAGMYIDDPEYEPDYESDPEYDQTGPEWWSDPPDK